MPYMPPLNCREIDTAAEREAVYRLRYDVYVREMGRRQRHADPTTQWLAEPLDVSAIHLGAFEVGCEELLGALRIHLTTRCELDGFPDVYGSVTSHETERFALVTRLVTRPSSRGGATSAGVALACAAYRRVLIEGIGIAYLDCDVQLVPLFEWLGFDTVHRLLHPDFGSIAVMRIDAHDIERLRQTGSPFLELRGTASPCNAAPDVRLAETSS